MLHGHVEDIAVEKPRLLAIKGKDHLVDDFKIPGFKPHELTKHLIVVPGDVKHLLLASNHLKEFAYHLHMLGREVLFLELPNVNDVAVQDEHLWINGAQVLQNFEWPATAHAEVKVGNDRHFNRAFGVSRWGKGHVRICAAGLSCALPQCIGFVMIIKIRYRNVSICSAARRPTRMMKFRLLN